MLLEGVSRLRQGKEERRPGSDPRFGPDFTTMAEYDALDGRKTDAGTDELTRIVQSCEYAEKLVRVLHIEAGAVIADIIYRSGAALIDPELNQCVALESAVFPGVVKKIDHNYFQKTEIAGNNNIGCDAGSDRSTGIFQRQLFQRRFGNCAQVNTG